jgi:hypothetical protein
LNEAGDWAIAWGDALVSPGYGVFPAMVSPELCLALNESIVARGREDSFAQGRTGRGEGLDWRPEIRTDEIFWLNEASASIAEGEWLGRMEEVRKSFRPEFVNRIDEIVVFHPLDARNIASIAKIQLKRLEQRLAAQEMALTVSDAALAQIAKAGFDPVYGARPLKRAIQQQIENPVARLVLEGKIGPKDVVPVDFVDGRFTFERTVH